MKNETVEVKKEEVKVGLTAASLPWWAQVLIAQHAAEAFPPADPPHIHHCSDCGCILFSTHAAYQYSPELCLECSPQKQKSQGGH